MNTRQAQILQYLVESHVQTGEPVSSSKLVRDFGLKVSTATVRNDLYTLEEEGFVRQPHTSAGRVPTEAGYRYYVDRMRDSRTVAQQEHAKLQAAAQEDRRLISVARVLADLTGETMIMAKGDKGQYSVYYTGIKNLFRKPEFAQMGSVVAISEILDNIEDALSGILQSNAEMQIRIGSEGPFGQQCSTISMRLTPQATYILLGPMRMQYGRNMALMRNVQQLLL